jgi:DNA-binding transcriptional ArsR family regulator
MQAATAVEQPQTEEEQSRRLLLAAVARVLREADDEAPDEVTEDQFEQAWTLVENPRCPQRVQTIRRRLAGARWDRIKQMALAADPRWLLAQLDREEAVEITPDDCWWALLVAYDRHCQASKADPQARELAMARAAYKQQRTELAKRPAGRDGRPLTLPTLDQITAALGISYSDALTTLGLPVAQEDREPTGVPVVDAILRHVELHEFLPASNRDLWKFAAQYQFRVAAEKGVKWSDQVAEAKARRAAAELETHPPPPPGQRPKYDQPVDESPWPDDPRPVRKWTVDEKIDALVEFLDHLGSGEAADPDRVEDSYSAWADGHPDRPAYETLRRRGHGGLTELLPKAMERRRARDLGETREPVERAETPLEKALQKATTGTLAAVLRFIEQQGEATAAEIAAATGLTASTVSVPLKDLRDQGVLAATAYPRPGVGGTENRYRLTGPLSDNARALIDKARRPKARARRPRPGPEWTGPLREMLEVLKTLEQPFTAKTAADELAISDTQVYRHLRALVALQALVEEPHPTQKRRFLYRVAEPKQ